MEYFPEITDKIRLPLEIEVRPYLFDHRFEGNAVLPAVEAMQLLAESTRAHLPYADMRCITNAAFDKFLHIHPGDVRIEAFNEIVMYENSDVTSKLITITRSKKASITRVKAHVTIGFTNKKQELPDLSVHLISALKGTYFDIPSDKIYSDLVPFGPAYHNITGNLHVSEKETVANIIAPVHSDALSSPLGSCFPLDAAFHAAKLETGNWKLETGNWKLETGNWKLETGNWKLETGNSKLETRNVNSKRLFLIYGYMI